MSKLVQPWALDPHQNLYHRLSFPATQPIFAAYFPPSQSSYGERGPKYCYQAGEKWHHWGPDQLESLLSEASPIPILRQRGAGAPGALFNATGLIACSENSSILNDPKWPLIPVIFPLPRCPATLLKQGWFWELLCSVNSRQHCGRPRNSGAVPREGWEIDENATGLFTNLIWFQKTKQRNLDGPVLQIQCSFAGLNNPCGWVLELAVSFLFRSRCLSQGPLCPLWRTQRGLTWHHDAVWPIKCLASRCRLGAQACT